MFLYSSGSENAYYSFYTSDLLYTNAPPPEGYINFQQTYELVPISNQNKVEAPIPSANIL